MWSNLKKLFLGAVCLGGLLFSPETLAAGRPDNKTSQRQSSSRRKKEKRNSSRRKKEKRNSRNSEQQEKENRSSPLSPGELQKKIANIRRGIEQASSKKIPPSEKKILLELFDQYAATDLGKQLFENVNPELKYEIRALPSGTLGNYAAGSVQLGQFAFDIIKNAKTPQERLSNMLYLVDTMAHETAHSEHSEKNLWGYPGSSFEERIATNKMAELHGKLEGTRGAASLLETEPYKHYYERDELKLTRSVTSYAMIKREKFYETGDLRQAEQFATTEFITSHWANKGDYPLTVNGKELLIPGTQSNEWNIMYNFVSYSKINSMVKHHGSKFANNDVGLEPYFNYFVNRLDLTVSPAAFIQYKSFNANQDRLVGYLNGIKNMEIDALQYGIFTKLYRPKDSQMQRFDFDLYPKIKMENTKIGNGKKREFYSSSGRIRAEYFTSKENINGIYKEYNEDGTQKLEIPVKDSKGSGYGWWADHKGQKQELIFKEDGICFDPKALAPEHRAKYEKLYNRGR